MADTMGLGTGEDMMVGGWWSFLAPIHNSCSESALLGDAEGPFRTNIKGQRDMTLEPGMEGKPMAMQIRTGYGDF